MATPQNPYYKNVWKPYPDIWGGEGGEWSRELIPQAPGTTFEGWAQQYFDPGYRNQFAYTEDPGAGGMNLNALPSLANLSRAGFFGQFNLTPEQQEWLGSAIAQEQASEDREVFGGLSMDDLWLASVVAGPVLGWAGTGSEAAGAYGGFDSAAVAGADYGAAGAAGSAGAASGAYGGFDSAAVAGADYGAEGSMFDYGSLDFGSFDYGGEGLYSDPYYGSFDYGGEGLYNDAAIYDAGPYGGFDNAAIEGATGLTNGTPLNINPNTVLNTANGVANLLRQFGLDGNSLRGLGGLLPSADTAAALAPILAAITYAKNQGPFDTSRLESTYDTFDPNALTFEYDQNTARGRDALTSSLTQRNVMGSSFGNMDITNYNTSRDLGRRSIINQGLMARTDPAKAILDAQVKERALKNDLYGRSLLALGNVFGGNNGAKA